LGWAGVGAWVSDAQIKGRAGNDLMIGVAGVGG
jgi:hypothetical protein